MHFIRAASSSRACHEAKGLVVVGAGTVVANRDGGSVGKPEGLLSYVARGPGLIQAPVEGTVYDGARVTLGVVGMVGVLAPMQKWDTALQNPSAAMHAACAAASCRHS
jgi:hypothetical protein